MFFGGPFLDVNARADLLDERIGLVMDQSGAGNRNSSWGRPVSLACVQAFWRKTMVLGRACNSGFADGHLWQASFGLATQERPPASELNREEWITAFVMACFRFVEISAAECRVLSHSNIIQPFRDYKSMLFFSGSIRRIIPLRSC